MAVFLFSFEIFSFDLERNRQEHCRKEDRCGAVYPVEDLMKASGIAFDKSIYPPAVISYYPAARDTE
ncbi:MAG: hypothetical protein ISR50_18355 [Alphaproteobacteria bacterium]|nr:hypothetical protein [Alphaproteobacteria bacterium]MBL6954602.1 hypothetical protein [Alphaproteobacteria bacterium]